ncbi:MAG: Verru_Chthon cassette protein B [Chthoniobacteraceae bacterium]
MTRHTPQLVSVSVGSRPQICRRENGRAAFSLIEVTIAIGVVAVALLSLLGVVPTGLNTLRSAMDSTVEAQIIQKFSGETLLTPFSGLKDKFSETTFYYDQEGQPQTSQTTSTRYWLTANIVTPLYPGSTTAATSGTMTDSLVTVQVKLVSAPSVSAAQTRTDYFNILVPNSGN